MFVVSLNGLEVLTILQTQMPELSNPPPILPLQIHALVASAVGNCSLVL
jgi:hypothetical protein